MVRAVPNCPGKSANRGTVIVLCGAASSFPKAPEYGEVPELSGRKRESLGRLEEQRVIEVDPTKGIGFSHSFYRDAAEFLVDGWTDERSKHIVSVVQRGLFCLSPVTSRATSRNIEWVFDKLSHREDAQAEIVDHAVDGLGSYFPATRDHCFRFLMRKLDHLAASRGSDVPSWIRQVTSVSLDDIEWHDGQANLPFGEIRDGGDFLRTLETTERAEVEEELSLLNSASN